MESKQSAHAYAGWMSSYKRGVGDYPMKVHQAMDCEKAGADCDTVNSSAQLFHNGFQSGNSFRPQPSAYLGLSFVPGRITLAQQSHSLLSDGDLMAAPIVVARFKLQPSPRAHACDIAAER
jgi:hypothetical protein